MATTSDGDLEFVRVRRVLRVVGQVLELLVGASEARTSVKDATNGVGNAKAREAAVDELSSRPVVAVRSGGNGDVTLGGGSGGGGGRCSGGGGGFVARVGRVALIVDGDATAIDIVLAALELTAVVGLALKLEKVVELSHGANGQEFLAGTVEGFDFREADVCGARILAAGT